MESGSYHRPLAARLTIYVLLLASTAAAYLATESEGVQVMAIFGFYVLVFVVLRLARGRGGADLPRADPPQQRSEPLRLLIPSLLAFVALMVLGVLVVRPRVESLGPWFGFLLVQLTWLETHLALVRRELRRTGGEDWRPYRPAMELPLAGGGVAVFLTVVFLIDGETLLTALVSAAACGACVIAVAVVAGWLSRRLEASPSR